MQARPGHKGAQALTEKILRVGVYWPTIYKDAAKLRKKCPECQAFAPFQNQPAMPLTNISNPWPFHQWGINIVGPFPVAPGGFKFLLVVVDHFTKWIEAAPLATVTSRKMIKFSILMRFGTPIVLISYNDT